MRIFELEGRVNFVDETDVFVGFCWSDLNCKQFGFFFSDICPLEVNHFNLFTENRPTTEILEKLFFDRIFHVKWKSEKLECGSAITLKLSTTTEVVFLTLFNCHDGYYSNGFEIGIGGKIAGF